MEQGKIMEAEAPTVRVGATPTGLMAPHKPPVFYRPDALPAAQPTASKHYFTTYYCNAEHRPLYFVSLAKTASRLRPTTRTNTLNIWSRDVSRKKTNTVKGLLKCGEILYSLGLLPQLVRFTAVALKVKTNGGYDAGNSPLK